MHRPRLAAGESRSCPPGSPSTRSSRTRSPAPDPRGRLARRAPWQGAARFRPPIGRPRRRRHAPAWCGHARCGQTRVAWTAGRSWRLSGRVGRPTTGGRRRRLRSLATPPRRFGFSLASARLASTVRRWCARTDRDCDAGVAQDIGDDWAVYAGCGVAGGGLHAGGHLRHGRQVRQVVQRGRLSTGPSSSRTRPASTISSSRSPTRASATRPCAGWRSGPTSWWPWASPSRPRSRPWRPSSRTRSS